MIKHDLHDILKQNAFFADLPADDLLIITGCAGNVVVKGSTHLAHEGDTAETFYVVREGKLRVEQVIPGKGPRAVQTLGPGEIVGWSWLFPPYRWAFDVRVLEDSRLIALDGACLRRKCEEHHSLGYRIVKKFAQILRQRLHASRLQVMDIYGSPEDGS